MSKKNFICVPRASAPEQLQTFRLSEIPLRPTTSPHIELPTVTTESLNKQQTLPTATVTTIITQSAVTSYLPTHTGTSPFYASNQEIEALDLDFSSTPEPPTADELLKPFAECVRNDLLFAHEETFPNALKLFVAYLQHAPTLADLGNHPALYPFIRYIVSNYIDLSD